MSSSALAVAWYRLRSTLPRRASGYVSVVVLIGLLGGLSMATLSAARRTQSSFSTFLASTHPSDLTIATFPNGPGPGYSPAFETRLRHLNGVEGVESTVQSNAVPLGPSGRPLLATADKLTPLVSVDGEYFSQDRPGVVAGRMANPERATEFVTTPDGAHLMGWHVGERVPFGFYTFGQIGQPGFQSGRVQPALRLRATLVGLVEFSDGIVQDQVDRYPTFALFTPRLAGRLGQEVASTSQAAYYSIRVVGGSSSVPRVERAINRITTTSYVTQVHLTSVVIDRSDRALRPDAIALGAFGVIAGLAALLITGQTMARQLRTRRPEMDVLRALGADRRMATADGALGLVSAVVVGTALAIGFALALSPIGPLGPVRAVYPSRGVAIDVSVFVFGGVTLAVALSVTALLLSRRVVPRASTVEPFRTSGRSAIAEAAGSLGAPVAMSTGVRFAIERGDPRRGVPVRAALAGMVVAVMVAAATLTFGSGLASLVSHPSLYGWNWNYALASFNGPDVPPQTVSLLRHEGDVAALSSAQSADPILDGRAVPALFIPLGSAVTPAIVSGVAPRRSDQVVLGEATLQQLHTHVGGTVVLSYGSPATAPLYVPSKVLRVVGTAALPAIGFPSSEGDHTSLGTGAWVPRQVLPPIFARALQSPYPTLNGPEFVFVRLRPGVPQGAAFADMQRAARTGDEALAAVPDGQGTGDTVDVLSLLKPAEIVDYRSLGATPDLLAAGLAFGAVLALTLALVASVRARRRELALLKTLGLTQRQLFTTVSVQATVIGLVGLVIGLPLGVVLGRWLWTLFAEAIYAVPRPTVSASALAVLAAGSLVLVNVVAALPGRSAARTPAALVLRSQ